MLVVGLGGSKSWIVRAQVNGWRHDIGLESAGLVNLQEARFRATSVRCHLRDGIDPVAERKAVRLAVSFETAALAFIEEQEAGWHNSKHRAQWTAALETFAFPR